MASVSQRFHLTSSALTRLQVDETDAALSQADNKRLVYNVQFYTNNHEIYYSFYDYLSCSSLLQEAYEASYSSFRFVLY